MAKGLKIDVVGADALISGLKNLSAMAEQIVSEEIEAGTEDIRTDAVRLVPVDTGRLRSSITSHSSGLKGEVTAGTKYAGYIEFGTGGSVDVPEGWEEMAGTWKGSGKRQINMPPRPYMRPALEKNAPLILDRISNRIDAETK